MAADPKTINLLKKYGMGKEAVWDCFGTWVINHKHLEEIARKEQVIFEELSVVELNSEKRICVMKCVARTIKDKIITYGESSPQNTKNMYPVAMAEKRAKGRAILKLAGLHGDFYEDEFPGEKKPGKKKTIKDSSNESAVSYSQNGLPSGWEDMTFDSQMEQFSAVLENASHPGNLNKIATPYKKWIDSASNEQKEKIDDIVRKRKDALENA
tara:strand:- start:1470 stop:2105 length:636 start_codon:yes stop_codon:yes gene_type:complete